MKDVLTCENPIYVSPTLAGMMGLETAIFLEQFHSRLQKCQSEVDGEPWFTGGIDALAKELPFMAPKAIRQTMKRLVKSGLIEVSLREGKKWYTLAYAELDRKVSAYRVQHGISLPTEVGEAK